MPVPDCHLLSSLPFSIIVHRRRACMHSARPSRLRVHTSLVSLDLTHEAEDEHDLLIFGNESIGALLCFGNLTFISLTGSVEFDFDDSTLADLARAWPCAKTLILQSGGLRPPSNTLQCLYDLARNCPHLEHLHLTSDVTVRPTGKPHTSQSRLKSLNIGQSPMDSQTLDLARIISAIFPGLGQLGAGVGDGLHFDEDLDKDEGEEISVHRQHCKYWHEVAKSLLVLVAIRAGAR
ncbi:hypothetical protein B0H13DRAFT_1890242 [Mycena leptocephala]|nr:hypothetical protein B0H13DRAFT_1890242 [Mycena leptocephala]